MKKVLSFSVSLTFVFAAALALAFIGCSSDDGGGDSSGDAQSSSSSSAEEISSSGGESPSSSSFVPQTGTILIIQNESGSDIDSVLWRGVKYGKIAKNALISKNVNAGQGYISLKRLTNPIEARTQIMVTVEENEKTVFVITGSTIIEEINPDNIQNSGTFATLMPARAPLLENLAVTEVGYTTAKLNVSIKDDGNPKYVSRGFCVAKELNGINYSCDTISTAGEFQKNLKELDNVTKYYVKAFLDNESHPRAYSVLDSFVTSDGTPQIGKIMLPNVSFTTATINSSVVGAGDPAFTKRGFCYSSDINQVDHSCEEIPITGAFQLNIANLSDTTKYYVKSFLDNGKHPRVYSDTASFTTLSGKPKVGIISASNVSFTTVAVVSSIIGGGYPAFTKRGFCYSSDIYQVDYSCEEIPITGAFQLNIANLSDTTKYYIKSFLDNESHPRVYSGMISFTTLDGNPKIGHAAASSVSYTTATISSTVLFAGEPAFTGRGFCLSGDIYQIDYFCEEVSATGPFQKNLSDLDNVSKYYFKAYLENGKHPRIYSSLDSFVTSDGTPQIGKAAFAEVSFTTATINSSVVGAGDPPFTGRGFCWSSDVYQIDLFCEEISATGPFQKKLTGLSDTAKYYVKAYLDNGVHPRVYSDTANFTTLKLCGGEAYNHSTSFCSNGEIHEFCGGAVYNPSEKFCISNALYPKCSLASNGENCSNDGNTILKICVTAQFNPSTQTCMNGKIFDALLCSIFGGTGSCVSSSGIMQCRDKMNNLIIPKTGITCQSDGKMTGSYIDTRANKTYKIAQINNQVWMAENLNYNGSFAGTYGAYYTWDAAKSACPAGWHLPANDEWNVLVDYVGGAATAGKKLKSASAWSSNGNGTDDFGFSALPGGSYSSGVVELVDTHGYWWTATETSSSTADLRRMWYSNSEVYNSESPKARASASVRCVRN